MHLKIQVYEITTIKVLEKKFDEHFFLLNLSVREKGVKVCNTKEEIDGK